MTADDALLHAESSGIPNRDDHDVIAMQALAAEVRRLCMIIAGPMTLDGASTREAIRSELIIQMGATVGRIEALPAAIIKRGNALADARMSLDPEEVAEMIRSALRGEP